MADKPQETKAQNGGVAVESSPRAAAQPARSDAEGAQQSMERVADAARAAAPGRRRGGEAAGDVLRQGGEVAADGMRHLDGVAGAAEGQRSLARHAARHFEETGARIALAMQDSTHDMCTLFALPSVSRNGLDHMRESIGSLVEGVVRTNMRIGEELFRMASPAHMIELQRRFCAEYIDTMLHSSAMLLRAARHAADDALGSLEERAEARRQRDHGGRNAHGRVADVMQTELRIANPEDTVQRAVQLMRETDAGALPVGEGDRLVGMVTDRDVALRLVAEGRDPSQTRVREVMTPEVRYVFEDDDLDHVADNMAEQQVRRLPVMNRDRRLVGVLSLADLARRRPAHPAGAVARDDGRQAQAAA